MIVRPFLPGTTYDVGDYVRDPDDGEVYQVKSPSGDPESDVQVLATVPPHEDELRYSHAPAFLHPPR